MEGRPAILSRRAPLRRGRAPHHRHRHPDACELNGQQSTVGAIAGSLGTLIARTAGAAGGWAGTEDRYGDRWASTAEMRPLFVESPQPGRLVMGRLAGRRARRPGSLLATESRHSVMVVGPTQTLKTSGLAIPALLEWDGPVVAASVKDDLVSATIAWRSGMGRTWLFDPAGSTRFGCDGWSPLGRCGDWVGARRTASALVAHAPHGGLADGAFWYAAAAKLLAPLLFAAATGGRTMADLVAWVDTRETGEVEAILQRSGCPEALNAARASFSREERQLSSIYTTAETVLEAFGDPRVGGVPGGHGVDVERLFDGGCHTLYVCSPAHEQARLRPLFSTLLEQVVNTAFDRATASGAPCDPPLLVVVDEAANIAPIPTLDALASTAAGHGIQLVTVWQDFAQIRSRYGERADTVVNNHRAKIFLSGMSDLATLDYLQRIAGERRRAERSFTRDGRGGGSTTWQHSREPLLGASAARRLGPGSGVLVYGHLPPARLALRPYFGDERLRERAGPVSAL